MKALRPLESAKKTFISEVIQSNEKIHYGHPELVNFPSTAEVFHAVFENSFHASCIGNGDGRTVVANETICKIFGYTREEMIGISTKEIFVVADSNYIEYLDERNTHGKAKADLTGIRKNGERFPCEISSIVFTDDTGERRTINTIRGNR